MGRVVRPAIVRAVGEAPWPAGTWHCSSNYLNNSNSNSNRNSSRQQLHYHLPCHNRYNLRRLQLPGRVYATLPFWQGSRSMLIASIGDSNMA